jgi:hypothetical protein
MRLEKISLIWVSLSFDFQKSARRRFNPTANHFEPLCLALIISIRRYGITVEWPARSPSTWLGLKSDPGRDR